MPSLYMAPGVQGTLSVQDSSLFASSGSIAGTKTINKFGRDPTVGTTETLVWITSSAYTGFLTSASTVRVKSGGNAADTAAGAGARTVTVTGLDENWAEAEETVTLAGASASSATTTTFIRVNRAWVATTGTYGGANTGNVVIETTSATTLLTIAANSGQSQFAAYTIPAGKSGYLLDFEVEVEGSKQVNAWLYQRRNADTVSAPFSSKRIIHVFPLAENQVIRTWSNPIQLPAKTDVYVTAATATGSSAVSATFDLLLVDD